MIIFDQSQNVTSKIKILQRIKVGIYIPLTFFVQPSLGDPAGSVRRWSAVVVGRGGGLPPRHLLLHGQGREVGDSNHTGDSRKQRQGRPRSMTDTLTAPDILPQAIVV